MTPRIREATPADIEPAVATLSAAFADYPFTRHTLAADDHLTRLADMQRLFITHIGLPHGRVWVSDNAHAVAVWTTPESTAIAEVFTDFAPQLAHIAGDRAAISARTESALAPHRPTTPTWFLGTVGVHPESQGQGLGKAVIEPGLRAADATGTEAFLETSLASNVTLYRKLGFDIVAEIDLPDDGPKTWAMRRKPAPTPA
ncbi:GNAT family N-acetyltransferase [Stackebrandtia nassauensis]|uniref:GCN5-related N-acetyltransferase n=1 Tax=Stackebrandtia nassauensis (strain DSM 44728 / CIP 108903 / NRRL B-16338 / NBRC 102104 / LLR-40K-21) TaxID=446470 RepID=D3Q0Z8_STANL|nr:GNAT family N-acetyltransferase [Stackebrandtia nassauensis]ADD43748.1 GCN5-related N-acetyltransferase [Stackebrandtia nassauensis DSM 44728]